MVLPMRLMILLAVKVAAAAVTPVGGALVGVAESFDFAVPFNRQSVGRCTVHAM